MNQLLSKKSQLGNLQAIIGTVIVIAVLVAAGFLVVQEFLEQDRMSDTSVTVTNETITSAEYIVGHSLEGVSDPGASSYIITQVLNESGVVLLSGNYSVSTLGVFTNASADADTTIYDWNVSYTYTKGDSAYEGVNSTLDAMETVPELLGLIVLVLVIGIILAIVFGVIIPRSGSSA